MRWFSSGVRAGLLYRCDAANSILRVSRTMTFRYSSLLMPRSGKSYGDFPSFPFDFALQKAPVRCPKHTRVENHGGHVIDDELERVVATGELQSVGQLPEQQKTNA